MSLTYVVTGASRGLGLEMVRQLVKKNDYAVIATCRTPASAEELKKIQSSAPEGTLRIVQLDIDDDASIQKAAKEIEKISPNGVDVLINNAGILVDGSSLTTTRKDLNTNFDTNVSGTMIVTQSLLPSLRKGSKKTVVNLSSILGSISKSSGYNLSYSVSKAALNMLTKVYSMALKDEDFTVVTTHPGWVQTDMGGKQAPLTPEASIKDFLSVVSQLKKSDNGKFFNYDGSEIAW